MATMTQAQRGAVLITGAAGGIGMAAVRRLDELGFRVFAGVRKSSDGERLQREISARITPVLFDITDDASIAQAAEIVTRAVGEVGLVGLVNNAGMIVEGPLELIPTDEIRKQFEVNVIGHIAVTQAFLPLLRKAKGHIVNISAPTGQVAMPYLGALSGSKAALEFVTDALRSELRPFGISVSIIEPGAMQTDIFKKSAASAQQFRQRLPGELLQLYAPALAAVAKALANQRLESPGVVVAAIVHSLTSRSPKTRYLAGRGTGMIAVLRLLPDHVRDGLLLRAFGLANTRRVS
ncbi:SDR family NAD(P)-dependent oxidoreductase [Dictyobacter arantiisoli]|uniref:Short-chain dehydrogenase n=1 Tax=Dictyobacter arantiisoli TaxID=2014874 RepID=A0A5A5T8R0_9CHLR|nr:SDR family NAD(P)-dependent oxidoreductase [Dictyobacter arantiisoli]GCF07294.1 short-chain dehydrogenase [Dictyobacter arantiisoli]